MINLNQENKKLKDAKTTDFFKNMLDSITLGGLFVDKSRIIRYCNENIEKIFGYDPEDVVGNRTDLLYGDRRSDSKKKNEIYNILEKKGYHIGSARGVRRDGKGVMLELSTFLIKSNAGAIIFVEKKEKVPAQIIDKDNFLQDLLDNIPDMIFFKDIHNKFILVNKEHAAALGLKPEDVIGKSDLDFFPKAIADKYFADDNRVMESGKPVIGKIESARRPDGGMTYVSTTKIPHFDKSGKIIGTIGITRNITDKMVAEEELRSYKDGLEDIVKERTKKLEDANEKLARMFNIKSEFTSMVSHELRTPLAILKEGIDLVADETLGAINEKQKRVLSMSLSNTKRLANLINDILDFSKLESKKMQFRLIKGNVNEIITQVLKGYEVSFEKRKKLKLKLNLDPSLPLVKLDPSRITQVLHNLINNAMKFTEKGFIGVESKAEGKNVVITARDTGCGIREEDLARIFEKFEQVTSEEVSRIGTGLGLAICKQIVEQLGGKIFAESTYGKGSTFCFTLPIEE